MAGTPGSGSGSGYSWPPYPSPSTPGGESQRAQLDAALRALREQRPQIAAEIGEYLYSLVLQGQLRDPIVLAACRRLYDHEQQVLQLEATLRALPVVPPQIPSPPPGIPPIVIASGREESATIISSGSQASRDADATRITPGTSSGEMGGSDAVTRIHHATPISHDSQPPGVRPANLESGETVVAPVRRPGPAAPGVRKTAERQCTHCRMPLRASDTTCPVCGRPVEQVVESPQCRRCGTELRPQDRTCPVCGTPRS
jgi:RNA polymerase subunit RPABC4/transcription elongation factor Spt4